MITCVLFYDNDLIVLWSGYNQTFIQETAEHGCGDTFLFYFDIWLSKVFFLSKWKARKKAQKNGHISVFHRDEGVCKENIPKSAERLEVREFGSERCYNKV